MIDDGDEYAYDIVTDEDKQRTTNYTSARLNDLMFRFCTKELVRQGKYFNTPKQKQDQADRVEELKETDPKKSKESANKLKQMRANDVYNKLQLEECFRRIIYAYQITEQTYKVDLDQYEKE